jgi:hypothetical protein
VLVDIGTPLIRFNRRQNEIVSKSQLEFDNGTPFQGTEVRAMPLIITCRDSIFHESIPIAVAGLGQVVILGCAGTTQAEH